jgi:hypothetical protein
VILGDLVVFIIAVLFSAIRCSVVIEQVEARNDPS